MRVIILAAGQGSRLRPLTDDKPKCMVEFGNMPLIKYQLNIFEKNYIYDINVVTGYLKERIEFDGIKKFYNPKLYKNRSMTYFCNGF